MALKPMEDKEVTYELYKEIAEELCIPVDEKLSIEVRYELYNSKMVFLRNLYEQCFRSVNMRGGRIDSNDFNADDLKHIHDAIEITKGFLHHTMVAAMKNSLASLGGRKSVEQTSAAS